MTTEPEPDLTDTQKAYNVAQSDMFQLAAYGHHRYHPLVEALTDEGKRQQRDYNDRLLAARSELEAALLRLVAEHAETVNSRFVSVDWLRSLADDPGMLSLLAVRPDEREDTLIAPPVPAGRDALRDRIAEALWPLTDWDGDQFNAERAADAVLAVLPPPADRAAELLALATVLEIPRTDSGIPLQLRRSYGYTDRWAICDRTGRRWHREHGWVYEPDGIRDEEQRDATRYTLTEAVPLARQLADPRRMADEAQQQTETPAVDRAALSEKLWQIAEQHIVAEWICCEPIEPGHHLCAKGYAALGMVKTLLVDSDPEKAWNPEAPVLDAVIAELEQLRLDRDLAIAHDRQPYPTAWAYEQACAALHRKEAAIERAERLALAFEVGGNEFIGERIREALAGTQPAVVAVRCADCRAKGHTVCMDAAASQPGKEG